MTLAALDIHVITGGAVGTAALTTVFTWRSPRLCAQISAADLAPDHDNGVVPANVLCHRI